MSDQPGEGAESSASNTDITEKVAEEGRPERIIKPTEKGLHYSLTSKTQQFWTTILDQDQIDYDLLQGHNCKFHRYSLICPQWKEPYNSLNQTHRS
ncbi:hypothetical protein ElyMa_002966600 [Elysia marginata]|uniref:Uncharacterized protein n=1 Tax=Elysia marginata TaxID=1093978 RepID=A0AAV4IAH1_9GAST|nr:hypothetical protein ElyMa_002966600 [Elysia marginata]